MERNIISRGRRSHDEITFLLQQKVQEGISTKDFCKMNGITTSTFYNWQKRVLPKTGGISANRFIPTTIMDIAPVGSPFAEIASPDGTIIRIFQHVSADYLKSMR